MDKIGDDCSCCQHLLPFNYFSPYHFCQRCLSCTNIGGVDQCEGQPLGSTEEIDITEDQPSNDEKSSEITEVITRKSTLKVSSEGETSTNRNKTLREEEMRMVAPIPILPIRYPLPPRPSAVRKRIQRMEGKSYDGEPKSEVTIPPIVCHEPRVISLLGAVAVMVMTPPLSVSVLGGNTDQKTQLIQTAFLTTAINSILQLWFGDGLPVIMQQSRNFAVSGLAIYASSASRYKHSKIDKAAGLSNQDFEESIKRIQGATIIGAIFQIIFGFSSGGAKFARHMSPLVMVPFISLTGVRIFTTGFSVLANCNIQLGLPALVLLVFSTQYLPDTWKSKRVLREYSVTIPAAILWIYAEILSRAGAYNSDASYRNQGQQFRCDSYPGVLDAAPWIKIPLPFPYGWPIFEVGDAFLIMAASFVDAIESTGINMAASTLAGRTPITPSELSRGIGVQGIGNLVNAIFGSASGSSSSAEQSGFMGLTQVGSRRVIVLSAAFMLVCSLIGKLGAFVAMIPLPIQAALQMVLIPIFGSTGLDYLRVCNMNSFRVLFILGISFFAGLSVPQYMYQYQLLSGKGPVRTNSTWFNDTVQVIFSSPGTVGVVVAFVLDLTHTPKDSPTKDDDGIQWEGGKVRHYWIMETLPRQRSIKYSKEKDNGMQSKRQWDNQSDSSLYSAPVSSLKDLIS